MRFKLLAALAALVALAATGCDSDNDTGGDARVAGNRTDRAFVAAMVPHHQSAVEMAKIAQQRGESAFVKQLADDIVTTQTEEIATLRREDEALDTAGVENGSLGVPEHAMGMNDDPAELRTAQPFDESFLQMMVPHHEGAIEMAKAELAKGQDPELKALAQQIIDAQEREISEMQEHRGMEDGSEDAHGSGHSG
jgi:uncharacterized protein (DUF305 family)